MKSIPLTDEEKLASRHVATVAVGFMGLSVLVMVLTIGLALFLPGELGYSSCVALYVAKVAAERHFRITSPMSMSLLAIYATLLAATLVGIDTTGYGGAFVFGALFIVASFLHLAGHPFTTFYVPGKGDQSVHQAVSLTWIIGYCASLAATLGLMPSIWFLIVPAVLMLVCAAAMLFFHFVWCGPSSTRPRIWRYQDLTFEQINADGPDFGAFCTLYARSMVLDPRQEPGAKSWEEVREVIRASEKARGSASIMFVCKKDGEVIATLRTLLDRKGSPLPTESDIDSGYDGLRAFGKLISIGRLAVLEEHRNRPELMTGLFSEFVNVALESGADFVVADGFKHVVPMYLKLGFVLQYPKNDPRHAVRMSHGYICYPVVMDFRSMVLDRAGGQNYTSEYSGETSRYLAERWFKRYLVNHMWRRLLGRHEINGIAEIKEVLLPRIPVRCT